MSITNDDLKKAIYTILDYNQKAAILRDALKTIEDESRRLSEITVPEMMAELGISTMTLESGETISYSTEISASIPKEKHDDAVNWLCSHGYADIVQPTITIPFDRTDSDAANEFARELASRGLNFAQTNKVHPMTLKASLKEMLRNGINVPLDLFGAREFFKTSIKIKK